MKQLIVRIDIQEINAIFPPRSPIDYRKLTQESSFLMNQDIKIKANPLKSLFK